MVGAATGATGASTASTLCEVGRPACRQRLASATPQEIHRRDRQRVLQAHQDLRTIILRRSIIQRL